jgi:hypothetical protein
VFSARSAPMAAHATIDTATEERCFLFGPCLGFIKCSHKLNKSSVNIITNPNSVYNHTQSHDNIVADGSISHANNAGRISGCLKSAILNSKNQRKEARTRVCESVVRHILTCYCESTVETQELS